MLSPQKVASFLGISKAVETCLVKRTPISAPISSSRGILIAFSGDNLVFDAINCVVTD